MSLWNRIDAELLRRGKSWAWLAKALGVTQQRANNWQRRQVPPAMHKAIADALGWTVDQLLAQPASPQKPPVGGKLSSLVAQKLSQQTPRIVPTIIAWEFLLSASLPERFAVPVPDDAMPPLKAGHLAIFSTTATPKGGDAVLVRDQSGEVYIRTYTVRRGTHWLAEAKAPGWAALDSVGDGLQVLAVLVGHEWG